MKLAASPEAHHPCLPPTNIGRSTMALLRSAVVALSLCAGASGFLLAPPTAGNANNRSPVLRHGTTTAAVRVCVWWYGVEWAARAWPGTDGRRRRETRTVFCLAHALPPSRPTSSLPSPTPSSTSSAHKRPPPPPYVDIHTQTTTNSGRRAGSCACRRRRAGHRRCPRPAWASWAPRATRGRSWCVLCGCTDVG